MAFFFIDTHYVACKLRFKCMELVEATVFSPQTCNKIVNANS